MATTTARGKASVEGVAATFDVILYPEQQSAKMTRNAEEEIIKDRHGFDTAWLFRNEHYTGDWSMKILGDTVAHAKTGAAFLALGSKVTISAADVPALNGDWQVMPGDDIDLGNTKVGDITFKLRKYADATQNALALTTPA